MSHHPTGLSAPLSLIGRGTENAAGVRQIRISKRAPSPTVTGHDLRSSGRVTRRGDLNRGGLVASCIAVQETDRIKTKTRRAGLRKGSRAERSGQSSSRSTSLAAPTY